MFLLHKVMISGDSNQVDMASTGRMWKRPRPGRKHRSISPFLEVSPFHGRLELAELAHSSTARRPGFGWRKKTAGKPCTKKMHKGKPPRTKHLTDVGVFGFRARVSGTSSQPPNRGPRMRRRRGLADDHHFGLQDLQGRSAW